MEKFELHVLGCGSALPTTRHFPTSQIVNVRDKLFMIDCGSKWLNDSEACHWLLNRMYMMKIYLLRITNLLEKQKRESMISLHPKLMIL